MLTITFLCDIIIKSLSGISLENIYGGIAQLARALGSYPGCRWFKSNCRYHLWPVGQEVKTPPFHGGNMGSIPVRVTIQHSRKQRNIAVSEILFYAENPI